MNKYINKKQLIIINIVIFLVEVILIYLLMHAYMYTDYISPQDVPFYEYLMYKFANLV